MSDLKPCPFCRSEDVRKKNNLYCSTVWCHDCGANIFRETSKTWKCLADVERDSGVKVVEAWNRRAHE